MWVQAPLGQMHPGLKTGSLCKKGRKEVELPRGALK